MLNAGEVNEAEAYLNRMKEARVASSVLKAKLVSIRSQLPVAVIFAFEGIHDKGPYHTWIARVSPELRFEPLVCSGKDGVLKLVKSVQQDLNGIGEGVYFFIDRDFDDLRDVPSSDFIYMTPTYSFENELVNSRVVEEVLKIELHHDAGVESRSSLLQIFEKNYAQFLFQTRDLNKRLFISKKAAIALTQPLPDKINKIAKISIEDVTEVRPAEGIIKLGREFTAEELNTYGPNFEDLEPCTRYRGKFSTLFFFKWLELLCEDRNKQKSVYFSDCNKGVKAQFERISLASLAAKSDIPVELSRFILNVRAPLGSVQ